MKRITRSVVEILALPRTRVTNNNVTWCKVIKVSWSDNCYEHNLSDLYPIHDIVTIYTAHVSSQELHEPCLTHVSRQIIIPIHIICVSHTWCVSTVYAIVRVHLSVSSISRCLREQAQWEPVVSSCQGTLNICILNLWTYNLNNFIDRKRNISIHSYISRRRYFDCLREIYIQFCFKYGYLIERNNGLYTYAWFIIACRQYLTGTTLLCRDIERKGANSTCGYKFDFWDF